MTGVDCDHLGEVLRINRSLLLFRQNAILTIHYVGIMGIEDQLLDVLVGGRHRMKFSATSRN